MERNRILVVDDDPLIRGSLYELLRGRQFDVEMAADGAEAMDHLKRRVFQLVIADWKMPQVDGMSLLNHIRSQYPDVSVILITGFGNVTSAVEAIRQGAFDYLTKPIQPSEVLARVEAMLRVRHLRQDLDRTLAYLHELEVARHSHRRRTLKGTSAFPPEPSREGGDRAAPVILLVDDEELTRQFYGDLLVEHGFQVVAVASGTEALAAVARHPVEAVVLDIMMPELSGLETLEQFRKRAPDLPVIILTAHPSSQNAITALKLGAFDFIVKGLQHELVVLAVRRAVHHFAELREKRHAIATLEARVRELEGRLAT